MDILNLEVKNVANNDKTPLYQQIEDFLIAQIEKGVYKEGESIPTEKEFSLLFNASRATVNKALFKLAYNGIIYRTPGRGSFVRMHSVETQMKKLMSFSEQMNILNLPSSTNVIGFSQVIARRVPIIKDVFDLTNDEFIHKIERVRFVNNEPIGVECIYLSPKIIQTIGMAQVQGSLYKYLEETLKLKIGSSNYTIKAIEVPDDIRLLFPCEVNVPILKYRQISFLMDGRAFEYNEIYYLGDKYEYTGENFR